MSPAIVAEAMKSYFYVIVWMSISITVILFNKWLLAYAGFPFPISLTLWHMFFCSVVGFLCVRVFKVSRGRTQTLGTPFPSPPFFDSRSSTKRLDSFLPRFLSAPLTHTLQLVPSHNLAAPDYCKRVVPIGLLYAMSLWLSNSSYLYLSVSFIQVSMLAAFLFNRE